MIVLLMLHAVFIEENFLAKYWMEKCMYMYYCMADKVPTLMSLKLTN